MNQLQNLPSQPFRNTSISTMRHKPHSTPDTALQKWLLLLYRLYSYALEGLVWLASTRLLLTLEPFW
jgi:hypothetical protein